MESKVKEKSQEIGNEIRSEATSIFQEWKQWVVENLSQLGSILNRGSEDLRRDKYTMVAGAASEAGRRIQEFADYIDGSEVNDFVDSFRGYARRRPEVVFGALFVGGLLASRFLAASEHRDADRFDISGPSEKVPEAPASTSLEFGTTEGDTLGGRTSERERSTGTL